MSDQATRFHETWLGMVQPVDGLVFSVPVLVDAQWPFQRHSPAEQKRFLDHLKPLEAADGKVVVGDLGRLFEELLELTPDLFDREDTLPEDLSLYVPEGRQTIRPTSGLKRQGSLAPAGTGIPDDSTPASLAGQGYVMLVWELPLGLSLDKPETQTGPWEYPPAAKFDRLLRHCRVPIGLLSNGQALRLVYAPHGESSGSLTFNVDDMAQVGGRPILDAFLTLLSAFGFFGAEQTKQLPSLLEESRKRQANVTNELAEQVLQALEILLEGFEAAAERDGWTLLQDALEREHDHLYGGLLTVLLRLVFLLYAEDRGLLPVDQDVYAQHLSVLGLYERLQDDAGAYPDSMSRRFGAWNQLVSLFRAVFLGVDHGELTMPPRHGQLFDPHLFPFLEGWGPAGSAPIQPAEARSGVRVPTVDDECVFRVLEKLLVFQGQRLSYRALDVEQIGSVYEALMGHHVQRVMSPAVCLRPTRVWVTAEEVQEHSDAGRSKWLKETVGLAKDQATKLTTALKGLKTEEEILEALDTYRVKKTQRARAGHLIIQPGAERRRTSSHYTPRSLTEPIVRRTLEPLLAAMGEDPSSERLLELKICDPAMGSGAFLVAACRFLGDQVVAAWTREGDLEKIADAHEDVVNHARRLVAERCLYGVDKNEFAVNLAKLSLWLVTLAKQRPFTFLDHALRHGDSLVGLSFDQIKAFHWKPKKQLELFSGALQDALDEAISLRQQIVDLAHDPTLFAAQEKEWLLRDADDAVDRVRLVGDLCVGAFFAEQKDKAREKERDRRLELITNWLREGGPPPPELELLRHEIRERVPVFHWMLEFPEVFFSGRPDPLEENHVNQAAYIEAFVGNPPFAGAAASVANDGLVYRQWLHETVQGDRGNRGQCDVSAYFFRRAEELIGTHGTIGFIATNTIAQGDTRKIGLKHLLADPTIRITNAVKSMQWPGEAAVDVAVVHLAKGSPTQLAKEVRLDGLVVPAINSRLRGAPERQDPARLKRNSALCFKGVNPYGEGFLLTPEEREELLSQDPKNAERVFAYIGGQEVNSSPELTHSRFIINFGDMELEEAARWPDLLKIVRDRVKPQRDKQHGQHSTSRMRRDIWWRFSNSAPNLYAAIGDLSRCLVVARVSKTLAFAFQPSDRVFSEQLVVLAFDGWSHFAVLQSRLHRAWALVVSSSLKGDLRYGVSDCFEPFPFPVPDPKDLSHEGALCDAGKEVYEARSRYMVDTRQGLSQTQSDLLDPACEDTRILDLRRLIMRMDRAVLDAYGWSDIAVPPYVTPTTPEEQKALEAFEDEVIDRLFVLNAKRAEEERVKGLSTKGKRKAAKRKSKKRTTQSSKTQSQIDW